VVPQLDATAIVRIRLVCAALFHLSVFLSLPFFLYEKRKNCAVAEWLPSLRLCKLHLDKGSIVFFSSIPLSLSALSCLCAILTGFVNLQSGFARRGSKYLFAEEALYGRSSFFVSPFLQLTFPISFPFLSFPFRFPSLLFNQALAATRSFGVDLQWYESVSGRSLFSHAQQH
jgi:hypothetical protein